jgi:type II secretory pathway pseudopilin PulG
MIVGIVAGIALPNLRSTLAAADAAHIVSDVSTVRLAAYQYLSETGVFPTGGSWGVVPPQMALHLADGFEFEYKTAQYAWISLTLPNSNNFWERGLWASS